MYSNGSGRARNRHLVIHAVLGLWLLCLALCWPGTASAQTIVVSPVTIAGLQAGQPYSRELSASGGTAPYTFALESGDLPVGLTLSGSTLSGTPTHRGAYSFTVRATDNTGAIGDRTYNGTVANPSLSLIPASATAIQGVPFSQTLATNGGVAPYTYALEYGTFPAGVTISSGGVISGTTSAAVGNYPVTLRITDGSTGPGSYFEVEPFTLTVSGAPSVSIAVSPASVSEDGATNLVYTVTRSLNLSAPTVVNLTTGGTATSGTDYTGALTTVTIPANATTATLVIDPVADTNVEPDETVIITVAAGSGYTVGTPASATGTILNDDVPRASISVSPGSVLEDSGTPLVYTVTLDQPSLSPLSINFTVGGSASSGSDFAAVTSPLVIPAGATTGTVTVTPIADTTVEGSETVVLTLSTGAGYLVGTPGSVTGTIVDDDQPWLSINDVSLNEGNSGTTSFTFTVSLSAPAGPGGVSFDIATADGTATAGSDYVAQALAGQVIPAGSSTYAFTVLVNGDTLNEPNEAFFVNVSNVAGATVADAQGVGTIINDDALPALSINDVTVTEGNAGTTDATLTVSLSAASGQTVTVNYATADGTALAPADYISGTGTLVFSPGTTTQTITVVVNGDTTPEADETFVVNLGGPINAILADPQGVVTVLNDDVPVSVAPTTLPNPTAGVAYSQTLVASGGSGSYSFAITSGALPTGLTLSTAGTVSGTPTASGPYSFTATATDTSAAPGPYTASQTYSISVAVPSLTLPAGPLPAATAGSAYSQTFQASGGIAPYVYSLSGGLPSGMSFNSAGTLSGTPTESGSFALVVSASDSTAGTPGMVTANYTLNVAAPTLGLSPGSLPGATAGTAYSQTFQASGGIAPYVYSVSGALPAGLAFDAASGTLSGVPTQSGSFPLSVSVSDSTTGTAATLSNSYTLSVTTPVLTLAPGVLPAATAGSAYSESFVGSGGIAPYMYSVSGALPAGLAFDAASGTLSGVPTQSGSFPLSVSVSDGTTGTAATLSNSYTLSVTAPVLTLAPGVLPAATAGSAYSESFVGSGGIAPYMYSVSGALPAGLAFDAASGTLSGVPTQSGSFPLSVSVSDSTTGTAATLSNSYTLSVTTPVLTLAPGVLPAATAGSAYSESFVGSGGIAPYMYSVSGALPAGLAFDAASGTLSGVPTQSGSFPLSVSVSDSTTGTAATLSNSYTLAVATPTLSLEPTVLSTATTGTQFSQAFSASGGVAPYFYALTGMLPAGLVFDPASGLLSGTPTQGGLFAIRVSATDSTGGTAATVEGDYNLQVILSALSLTPATLPAGAYGQAYRLQLSTAGGTAPYRYQLSSGSLPSGMSLGADGLLQGTPAMDGSFALRITVSDAQGSTGEQDYVLQIALRPDPSADAEVRGLLSAQAETARRFSDAQVRNFMQRLQRLHGASNNGGYSNNLAFGGQVQACDDWIGAGSGARLGDRCDPQRRQPFDHEPVQMAAADAGNDAKLGFWLGGMLRSGRDSSLPGGGTDVESDGLSLGTDYRFSPTLVAGAGIGYGRDRTDVGRNGSRSDAEALALVLYASYQPGQRVFLDLLFGHQLLDYQLRRHVTADGSRAGGSRDGQQWFAALSYGADFSAGEWQVTPYAGVTAARGSLDGYAEGGNALYTLRYSQQDVDSTTGNAGLRLSVRRSTLWGAWSPQMNVEYQHDFQGNGQAWMQYTNASSLPWYRSEVIGSERNRWQLGAGVQFELGPDWGLRMDYRGLLGDEGRDRGLQLSVDRQL